MHKSGHLVLVKTTLSVMPIYMAISISLPPLVAEGIGEDFQGIPLVWHKCHAGR
jgi:hypothetical protein